MESIPPLTASSILPAPVKSFSRSENSRKSAEHNHLLSKVKNHHVKSAVFSEKARMQEVFGITGPKGMEPAPEDIRFKTRRPQTHDTIGSQQGAL